MILIPIALKHSKVMNIIYLYSVIYIDSKISQRYFFHGKIYRNIILALILIYVLKNEHFKTLEQYIYSRVYYFHSTSHCPVVVSY